MAALPKDATTTAARAPRTSTMDPVADLRAAADAIREDHPAARYDGRFWYGIAEIFGRAAGDMDRRPSGRSPGEMHAWNSTVQTARAYLDHGADPAGRR